ncbi:hypothetical protein M409DRAFT_53180 [Zasmidium cellare ATCC 36951]|uniref:Ketoreductase (KR) domain-containing protein n=1 Tax=Zasmidium cellare ATCC 36951 TaxID=1080233 RepID=A0A6A6CQP5_ZASCE|nr:uncharacterized protein M409DRAFT_53180 [Zasmidium cellare ATCC 36951]KAF2168518.1 hypothetical protein M409DRAFT_53180 [Zasmidium cellare ATCC 36951]
MAPLDKEIVLITGGSTGLGFEIAKKLLKDHPDRFHVLIGARTRSKGEAAVKDLHSQGLTHAEFLEIDVNNNDSIAKAVKEVDQKFGRLDVLHENAGIAPDKDDLNKIPISDLIMQAVHTNVAGTAQTADDFRPLLEKASNPRIIFMSTGLGSLGHATKRSNALWPAYSSSKAALNMIMLYYWHLCPGMKINACCPGFRATNLNNYGQGAPPNHKPGELAKGAINAVRLTLLGKDGESGTYTDMDDATGEVRTVAW